MPQDLRTPALRRGTRAVATTAAVSIAAGAGLLIMGAAPASAASLRSQAVGRFLDGAAGGTPIQAIADLKDARATNPGTPSAQNPLDVTLGGQATIPLSGKLQAPGYNVFHVGVANQIARARANGYALGAAGAVANQGGASLGGASGSYPSNATLTLSPAALPSSPIALPGGISANALGSLTASIGAVSAKAFTPAGFGNQSGTHYNIASLQLKLGSPALGALFGQLRDALTPPELPENLPTILNGLPGAPALPPECSIKAQVLSPVNLAGGAVTIDPHSGSLDIDVAALVRQAGANINSLPANTDLLAYVLSFLTDPNGLSQGLQRTISSITNAFSGKFMACEHALPQPIDQLLQPTIGALTAGQKQVKEAAQALVDAIAGTGGSNPLAPIANGLKQALQLGVNVQPNGPRGSYRSPLAATPDQATAVVPGQTIVRALEIDLGGGSGVSLALANAAAGPGQPAAEAAPPVTRAPRPIAQVEHNAAVPTGVPAGQGPIDGGNGAQLPLVLLGAGLLLALAGSVLWRRTVRGH